MNALMFKLLINASVKFHCENNRNDSVSQMKST